MTNALDRRAFLKAASLPCFAACGGALIGSCLATPLLAAPAAESDEQYIKEAKFYEKQPYKKIKCKLCPRECVIDEAERGYCGVRENRGGTYYTLVHSRVVTAHIDPIEKKPFFHFLPGAVAFSLATAGCNVNCKMCQNWEISQVRPEQVRSLFLPPNKLTGIAQENHCPVIAYTYSEPVVFAEYVLDGAEAARAAGLRSVVVSGGYIQDEPLKKLSARVDAIKIDLKAYSEKFYKEIVNGELKHVLEALVTLRKTGVWNEIVYLVIPTLNDSDAEFQGLARWVKSELGPDVPLHFSRFHPEYLLKNLPPTPVETLERAKAIADAEGLHYVYIGNVPGHPAESTYCPHCHKKIVDRTGYTIAGVYIHHGKCKFCQTTIPGVWA
jgi:pyruvate formate lyase activating enzyme